MEETVIITKKEYDFLIERADKLARLECYGVDNWEGYGLAMCDEDGLFEEE